MVFMCQKDSFLKQYDTKVTECEPVEEQSELNNAGIELQSSSKIFRVILEDTILFPEGGGQPDDHGTIDDKSVIRSIRKGIQAIHFVSVKSDSPDIGDEKSVPFKAGDNVTTKIDWKRRFTHMQQHSGQHLITAITDSLFGFSTTSWWLGSEESNIELDTSDISPEQIEKIEIEANSKIRECVPVSVDVVELDDPKLKVARGRNLPDDVKGQIRIVTMAGVESNVCCGTHVSNLSQLQVIKLLHVVKKKGKCWLHFMVGDRVIERFSQQFRREQLLMGILKSSPVDLADAAEKLNMALKQVRKTCQVMSKDLATLEAKKLTESANVPAFWAYHRDNADLDFANALLRELGSMKSSVILVTIKTEGSSGHMMLVGGDLEKDKLTSLGESLCGILDGKGNIRGNLFQAKVNKVTNVKKAVKFAEDFMQNLRTVPQEAEK